MEFYFGYVNLCIFAQVLGQCGIMHIEQCLASYVLSCCKNRVNVGVYIVYILCKRWEMCTSSVYV